MDEHRKITVVMYHYVRNIRDSRYPKINGLEIDRFRSQLDYLQQNYVFIRIEQLVEAIETGVPLPRRAVLLTFSDSYADHFNNVFPLLDERGIQGCFYPEIAAIEEHKVLVNHKIHYILAAAGNSSLIRDRIFSALDDLRKEFGLRSNAYYYEKWAKPSKYDTKETIFIKRILQTGLPEEVSQIIASRLFDHFVGVDEKVFHAELYLKRKQIACMMNHGMHFGILGYHHRRYDTLDREAQKEEITRAKDFLMDIGADASRLSASYPWGAYNQDTLDILQNINCKVAFTTHPAVADLAIHAPLELPRLDTNDIPQSRITEPGQKHVKV